MSPKAPRTQSRWRARRVTLGLAALAALAAFLVYLPSLPSGFVYDTSLEIQEGFVTSLANLPAVLSLKVLGMNVILASRPGQILYLMLVSAFSESDPLGYHIGSNLLHAANVALLFILLTRLVAGENADLLKREPWKIRGAIAAVSLLFALHPLAVETVANVGYSSDLLVAFFTLLALLAATFFDPRNLGEAAVLGGAGTLCALAAVSCKESGVSTAGLLVVYWFLFRFREARGPWLGFLGAAATATAGFLTARFLWEPPIGSPDPLFYLGGSLGQVFWIQPRLWVFMLGKVFWPVALSADYTLENIRGLSSLPALAILAVTVFLQGWLAWKSRLGAFGMAIFWLGLATVSNFLPLFCIEADRYYYLPMAGLALEFLALLLLVRESGWFRAGLGLIAVALVPLTVATLNREPIFASDVALWKDALRVNPADLRAYRNLGNAYSEKGELDRAIGVYEKALAMDPNYLDAHFNLGVALSRTGRNDEAMAQFRWVIGMKPDFLGAHFDLGILLMQIGRAAEAIEEFQEVLRLNPGNQPAQDLLEQAEAMAGRKSGSR